MSNKAQSLEEVYEKLQQPLAEVEEFRLTKAQTIKKLYYGIALFVVAILLGFTLFMNGNKGNLGYSGGIFLMAGAGVALIISLVYVHRTKLDYADHFKANLLKKLVSVFYPSMSFSPKVYVSENDFINSELFGDYTYFTGEDYFKGTILNIPTEFSELFVQKKTSSGKNSTTTTIFDGLFFILTTPSYFNGRTVILPDTAESLFGSFGKKLQEWFGSGGVSGGKLIHFDDNKSFEDKFAVYSSYETDARTFISRTIQDGMLHLVNHGVKIRASFNNNRIYIAFSTTKNYFQPNWDVPVYKKESVEIFCKELVECLTLAEQLIQLFLSDTSTNDLPNQDDLR